MSYYIKECKEETCVVNLPVGLKGLDYIFEIFGRDGNPIFPLGSFTLYKDKVVFDVPLHVGTALFFYPATGLIQKKSLISA